MFKRVFPAGIYLFKVNNKNTRTRCEKKNKVVTHCSSVSIVNFEQVNSGCVLNPNIKDKTHQNSFPGNYKNSILNEYFLWGDTEVKQKEIWTQHLF